MGFKGFPSGKAALTPVPGAFFSELLPEIQHMGELKLILYFFWRLDRQTGSFRYLRREQIAQDALFMSSFDEDASAAGAALDEALQHALADEVLLIGEVQAGDQADRLYFLNTPKGRAAIQAIKNGRWRPQAEGLVDVELAAEPRNIFRLYEENIGPLTPIMAETLGEAEDTYPPAWIEQAFRIAVERNARNWRYIEKILKRWQEEGRDDQEDRRDPEKASRKYIEGEYSDFIKH